MPENFRKKIKQFRSNVNKCESVQMAEDILIERRSIIR